MNRVDLLEAREVEAQRGFSKWLLITAAVLALFVGIVAGIIIGDDQSKVDAANAQVASLQTQLTNARAGEAAAAERADSEQAAADGFEAENTDLNQQIDELQQHVQGLEQSVQHWKKLASAKAHSGGYSVNAVSSFGDGTWRVGEEIQPGTYRAPGGGGCYWERLSGFSGNLGDIITNDFGTKNGTVTISSSDVGFHTEDCGTWHKI